MKTKMVSAGIDSWQEAYKRMIDGEVFYTLACHDMVYFDSSLIDKQDNPFRYETSSLYITEDSLKDCLVKVECEWYEDIPAQGVLCKHDYLGFVKIKTSDIDFTKGLIFGRQTNGEPISIASLTPATQEEIHNLLLENQGE